MNNHGMNYEYLKLPAKNFVKSADFMQNINLSMKYYCCSEQVADVEVN